MISDEAKAAIREELFWDAFWFYVPPALLVGAIVFLVTLSILKAMKPRPHRSQG